MWPQGFSHLEEVLTNSVMSNLNSKPNPALGCVIFLVGAVVLGLISFSAVGGILVGGGLMLGLICIVFNVIRNGSI
jgi:hypothetical protein